jgi:hypothetical protein
MPSVTQPAEFFVAGGPVQPERACYVERAADRQLQEAVAARRLCWVVGPRATGKTSMLLRVAHLARQSQVLVAFVDWRKLAEQVAPAPDRGARILAERIAAELKLGSAVVESWWSARDAHSTRNPLVDFFWEVVLTNTTAPILVLVDDLEAAPESTLARDFFAAVAECQGRRAREPDFRRLGFVLAGCVSPRSGGGEPRVVSDGAEVVEPADFSADEAYQLAVAFGGEPELAHALLDRIYVWTGGQPYLTQKVARGVARKGGRLEDVERIVNEQFLGPSAATSDPL